MFLKKQFNLAEAAIIAANYNPQTILENVQWMHTVRSRGNQPGGLNPTVLAVWDDAKRRMVGLVESIQRQELVAVTSKLQPSYWVEEMEGLVWYEGIPIADLMKWCDERDGIPPILKLSAEEPDEKNLSAKERDNLRTVIGSLLAVIEGDWCSRHEDVKNRAALVKLIVEKAEGVSGLSKRNLDELFATATSELTGRMK
jgi:hypothetical protein